ncbi:HAMP domain-containing methyl-accepting chemotaxis protein [Andreprevotia chitinilytica]|uniref:HAMP domain-containing methyl-accepting chemotaxis protein n=1 Tax=Andreprevotia chitinilytica TaxID=396808 RepID=UPI00054D2433|nr:methyl-accepting chemotaxis protein [Andreprevotia chitinilytica]
MKRFLDLNTRLKLLLGFGVALLGLLIVIALAYSRLTDIEASQKTLFEHDFSMATELIEFRADENRLRSLMLEVQLENRRAEQDKLVREIHDHVLQVDTRLKQLNELGQGNPAALAKLGQIRQVLNEYRHTRQEQLMLIYAGKIEQAQELGRGIQRDRFEHLRSIALELDELAQKNAQHAIVSTEHRVASTLTLLSMIGVMVCAACIMQAFYLSDVVAGPLTILTARARRIVAGDIPVIPPTTPRRDEIGILEDAFNQMAQALQEKTAIATKIAVGDISQDITPQSSQDVLGHAFVAMIDTLRERAQLAEEIAAGQLAVTVMPRSSDDTLGHAFALMVQNLRDINREIQAGMDVLSAASSEILSGTTQMASGAQETATSIVETTTTVEEVRQTAQVSADKARHVSDSAQRSAEISQNGKQAVEETVDGMQHIQVQMESIARSIIRLSEQTHAISEIIATVNELAEQSNLLAINAAIEAAKAGDHGKGFTVVAQEVRHLAAQSKQATAQVRNMLVEIQKATSEAVLATEQGSKAVTVGVKLSNQAGEAIRQLAASLTESAHAGTQILISAQQQLTGMDQLAITMESIRVASTQSMASLKQAETTAQDLHHLGQRLRDMLGRFRL